MLFLDLDGTLLDDERRHYAVYTDVLQDPEMRGVPIPSAEYWGLRKENKPIEEILKRSRLFPTKYQAYRDRFDAKLEAPEMLGLDSLKVGVENSLGKLYTKTPIVLVTQRRDGEALESQLSSMGIRKYFVTVLAGAPKRERRPNPDARWKHKVALIRTRYRLPPTQAVYIGDIEIDVKTVRDLGFEVFLIEIGRAHV